MSQEGAGPSSDDGEGNGETQSSFRESLRFWLNMAVKLTVPLGAVAGIWLAHTFDAQQSVRQIANQREQSESSLRATMFGNLIGPIVGPQKDKQAVDPVRYALLVQLLALNFHEHFEFRPLIEHSDELLAKSSLPDARYRRLALKTVAHRIIDRQIASLWEESIDNCESSGPTQVTFWLLSPDQDEETINDYRTQFGDDHVVLFKPDQRKTVTVHAPNCKDTLEIDFSEPQWSRNTVDVNVSRSANYLTKGATQSAAAGLKGSTSSDSTRDAFTFTLSSFSFPFTDNTLLADGNRFALFIRDEISSADGERQFIWKVQLRWFPAYYYALTERPIDYEVLRKTLNIVPAKGVKQ